MPRLKDIGDRDGWECHLCGLPVDPATRYPAPGAPSLDHLIPKSHGGRRTADNLRLAHVACNSRRGHAPVDAWLSRPEPIPEKVRRKQAQEARRAYRAAILRAVQEGTPLP